LIWRISSFDEGVGTALGYIINVILGPGWGKQTEFVVMRVDNYDRLKFLNVPIHFVKLEVNA
jgi:hypothetical protein